MTTRVTETPVLQVHCNNLSNEWPALGDKEAYSLSVSKKGILIKSKEEWGLLHGLETLAQMIRPQAEDGWLVLEVTIKDKPAYPWRGLCLDVCRHWLGVEAIKRVLDGMAISHLNVLHLHLSDDQAFRLQIGALSSAACTYDGHGFSKKDIRALARYAADRGIRLVPEIDIPGHCTALLAGHPTLSRDDHTPSLRFGGHTACLDPSHEHTYVALQTLLAELTQLFPDNFVHLGSDEVHSASWQEASHIKDFMRQMSMADTSDLLVYFNKRLFNLLHQLGKSMVVWDDALHRDLPKEIVVQCWRSVSVREQALIGRHRVIFSSGYYLDLSCAAHIHYNFDPGAKYKTLQMAENNWLASDDMRAVKTAARQVLARTGHLTKKAARPGSLILGGEACLWSELVDEDCLDTRLFSRLPAIAERLWIGGKTTGFLKESLYNRLQAHWYYLEANTRLRPISSPLERLLSFGLSKEMSDACNQLLAWVEPIKWYRRLLGDAAVSSLARGEDNQHPRPYSVHTALDRIVDLCPPESVRKYELEHWTRQIAADPGHQEARFALRTLAEAWQKPLTVLQETTSIKVRELLPLAHQLNRCGILLIRWLELQPDQISDQSRYELELGEMTTPVGELTLAIVPQLHVILTAFCRQFDRAEP